MSKTSMMAMEEQEHDEGEVMRLEEVLSKTPEGGFKTRLEYELRALKEKRQRRDPAF